MRIPDAAELLMYEIHASWWADKISNAWLQDLAAKYFAWKVNRKRGRWVKYKTSIERIVKKYGGT